MDICSRCGKPIDKHGAFDIDYEHLCWFCFKQDEIKNERDWDEDTYCDEEW